MIIWYKNSFLASVVSILGCAFAFGGLAVLIEGDAGPGLCMAAIGIAVAFWGRKISHDKAFKTWWKQVEDANLVNAIAQDANLAVQIYNKNPQKRTLAKIEELNPAAAQHIRNSIAKK